ncbi:nucleoside/nucleotide kinase family protein [Actinotalea fermentans]|uniref:Adenylylsulfate kinase n=1 Tax=Actinotalea fermentans TaxID=43671 RepID=A0A511Z1Y4_9CELL|nr:ATP-binding protein [Actinotalea fermentans]GEN81406.1 hypothetical protein AFE02nite_31400 [Actinotalea fermentans]
MRDVVGALRACLPWRPVEVPAEIPTGDMPGDRVSIGPAHVAKANALLPMVVDALVPAVAANPSARAVVAVAGGSGVGKSEIASLLAFFLRSAGVGAYTLSGDNYPRRIPAQNDAERLRVFRDGGVRGLVVDGLVTPERTAALRALQADDADADPAHVAQHPWLASYQRAGRSALAGYLGTPAEIDFDHLSAILGEFKNGASRLHLRRMGRGPADLWYEAVDVTGVDVVVVEWTHGASRHLRGVDVRILLNSTPAETLAHRRARGRDGATDSPFTALVLGLEQEMLDAQAPDAAIILAKSGERLTFPQYRALMARAEEGTDG